MIFLKTAKRSEAENAKRTSRQKIPDKEFRHEIQLRVLSVASFSHFKKNLNRQLIDHLPKNIH